MEDLAYGVAGTILEKLGSFAYEEICLATSMKKDLKKLQEKTSLLQSVLGDAEKKKAKNKELQMWLVRVKDVFNDAVDVLDEFDCEMLRRQVVKEYDSAGRKVSHFFSGSNPIAFRFSIAHKVKEIRESFDEIVGDMAQFQLISAQLKLVEEPSQLSHMNQPFFNALEVIGRDDDKDAIMAILLSNSHDRLSVISIEGIGGMGKTTLVKSVFDDSKHDNAFNLKIWVVVSMDFDVIRLERAILKEMTGDDYSNMEPHRLQESLRSNLHEKKVLLVLDDVWNEDRQKWKSLRDVLVAAKEGSKVIVTTRSAKVSSIMTRTSAYELKGLSEERSMSLFFTCAFDDEKLADDHRTLKEIGMEIVGKCRGVPLALKTLGSLLYSKDEVEWKRVRDNEIWELEREDGHILAALRLSYNTMSPCLKQCFAYCSTFPDDTLMDEIELIAIWMAHGILHSRHEDVELEDIAKEQFKELRARSFFQSDKDFSDSITKNVWFKKYKMHDLIHDLARSVTENESCIIKSNPTSLPKRVRHLRISLSQDNIASVEASKKLCSLFFDDISAHSVTEFVLSTWIKKLKYLRVFDLKGLSFLVLPKSIKNLKHLRYLNLSKNICIKRLPDSLCTLQSLQTLLLGGCSELEELPKDIRRLVSLRTLVVTTKQYSFLENGIGRLKSLRTLIVEECVNLKLLPRDMKYCTTLRTLILRNCGELNLACESDDTIKLSLQKLVISGLPKMTDFSPWLEGASGTLELFSIRDCEKLSSLPEWLQRCTQLQTLEIWRCNELATLPNGMQHLRSLKDLVIVYCPKLIALPHWISDFTSLEKLEIQNCEELLVLPEGMKCLTSLASLVISNCQQLELASEVTESVSEIARLQVFVIIGLPETTSIPKWLQGASNTLKRFKVSECPKLVTLPEWLPTFSSLATINIWRCDGLLFLPTSMQHLTSLTSLVIGSCKQLELASESSEIVHLSLQSFVIQSLPKTTALPQWLQGAAHTLKTMNIRYCHRLAALPEWLVKLTSLEKLIIKSCPELSSLPKEMSSLTSLTHLEIKFPSSAFYERYQPGVGRDWSAISHVPKIDIGSPRW